MISSCLKLLVKLRIQNYSDFHTSLFYCPRTLNHKRKYWHGMLATKPFWHRSLSYGTKNSNCYRRFGSRNLNQPKHANSVRSMKILNVRFALLFQDWYKQHQNVDSFFSNLYYDKYFFIAFLMWIVRNKSKELFNLTTTKILLLEVIVILKVMH